MNWFQQIGVIIVLALLGFRVLTKLRFPAPSIMGPMFFVGGYQIFVGNLSPLPTNVVNIFLIILGLSIGARINDKKLAAIKKIWLPALLVLIWTIVFTLGMTYLIHFYTDDILTAFFSAAPGGLNIMTTLALSHHSEVVLVSTFQFLRLLVILLVVPLIAKFLYKGRSEQATEAPAETTSLDLSTQETKAKSNQLFFQYGLGICGGILLTFLHFPSGGIIGSLFGIAAMNVWLRQEVTFPPKVMKIAFLGIGTSVGLEFSPVMVHKLQEMFVQIIVFSLVIVLSNFILAFILHRITRWDIITCLLGSTSGGLSQMLVLGDEMNANSVVISILQLVRLLTIITCVPLLTSLIAG